MSQDQNTAKKANTREGLALVVGGLFVLGIVFATYSYFNKGISNSGNTETAQSALDKLKDIISSNTVREEPAQQEEKEVVEGTNVEQKKTVTTTEPQKVEANTTVEAAPVYTNIWTANDYTYGDIKGGSYTVKAGDTLWEISEGVYGNGFEWTKVLNANSSSVGFLPSGQQALIVPGQILVLP